VTLRGKLERQDAHVRTLEQAAARAEASLVQTRSARSNLISELSARRDLQEKQIARIDAIASASAAATAKASVQAPAEPPVPAAPAGARMGPPRGSGHAALATRLPVLERTVPGGER